MSTFWSGEDFTVHQKTVARKGDASQVNVVLRRENFPPISKFLQEKLEFNDHRIPVSTRSCFAQAGIGILSHPLSFFYEFQDETFFLLNGERKTYKDAIRAILGNQPVIFPLTVRNYGEADIILEEKVALGRFFHFPFEYPKKVDLYEQFLATGDLQIDGEYGVDFWLIDKDGKKLSLGETKEGVRLQVKLTDFCCVPQSVGEVVIKTKADTQNILTPHSSSRIKEAVRFFIGETPKVQLSKSIALKLEQYDLDGAGVHISSPLIDPGFQGPVRTEIVYSSLSHPSYVEFDICRV